jgi:hypothetical protein
VVCVCVSSWPVPVKRCYGALIAAGATDGWLIRFSSDLPNMQKLNYDRL